MSTKKRLLSEAVMMELSMGRCQLSVVSCQLSDGRAPLSAVTRQVVLRCSVLLALGMAPDANLGESSAPGLRRGSAVQFAKRTTDH